MLFKIINSQEYLNMIKRKNKQEIELIQKSFKHFGKNSILPLKHRIIGAENISIGLNFYALDNLRLETFNTLPSNNIPQLIIRDNVNINSDVHIGCSNRIIIGNNVLIASRVFITDHSHGDIKKEALNEIPALRPLVSKGPVILGDNIWIGEGVCILPNVIIGENTIIGSNSVVTKSFPSNCVIAGIPAKIIKYL
jgi:acetyltransferase-like isoleucine patch superfamily enzyme